VATIEDQFSAIPNSELAFLGTGPIPAAHISTHLLRGRVRRDIPPDLAPSWPRVRTPRAELVHRSSDRHHGNSVLIVRDSEGRLRAFHNVCTHRGTKLVWEESGRSASFSCHYYRWNFTNTGRLRTIPDYDRFFDLDTELCGLRPISIDAHGCFHLRWIHQNLSVRGRQGPRTHSGTHPSTPSTTRTGA
jgi:nitrite reductase/ring-hydroxylating ferredoxin subunit